ncbi:MAG: YkvA family protein [Hyphomicrobiales bacterium]
MAQQDHTTQEDYVRAGFWPKLARGAARLPFADELLAAWYCATDQATPLKVKATLFGALAYFILPIDAIPDVIVGLGFTDDMAVLMTALALVRNHVTAAHRLRARETLDSLRDNPVTGSAAAGSQ